MIKDFLDGIRSYGQAFGVIRSLGLWRYVIYSGLISFLVGSFLVKVLLSYGDKIGNWLSAFYTFDFGQDFVQGATDFIASAVLLLGGLMIYKYVVLIITSPFMSILSEKIEHAYTGAPANKFSIGNSISDMIRGLRITLRNLSREMLLTIGIFILGLIPMFTIVTTPLIFIIQAYYAGFGNIDYRIERHLNVRSSARYVKRHQGFAIGNGTIYLLLLLIPVLGLFLAPALGTTAATLESLKRSID